MSFKKDREYWFNRTANCANAIRDLEERIASGVIPKDAYRDEQAMTPDQYRAHAVRLEELKREALQVHTDFVKWNNSQTV